MATSPFYVPRCELCKEPMAWVPAPHENCAAGEGWMPVDDVERQVRNSMVQYPTLFGREPWGRWYVFNQLFFVIGNGFEWWKGRIVSIDEDPELPLHDDPRPIVIPDWYYEHETTMARLEDRRPLTKAEIELQYLKSYLPSGMPERFYEVSESSLIMTIPRDVTWSWLIAAHQAFRMFSEVLRQVIPEYEPEGQPLKDIGYREKHKWIVRSNAHNRANLIKVEMALMEATRRSMSSQNIGALSYAIDRYERGGHDSLSR